MAEEMKETPEEITVYDADEAFKIVRKSVAQGNQVVIEHIVSADVPTGYYLILPKAQLAKQDSDLRLTPEEIKKLYEKWENSPANSVPNFDVYLEEAQLAKQECPELDREKIFETIYYHKFPDAVRYKVMPFLHDRDSEELTDKIIATCQGTAKKLAPNPEKLCWEHTTCTMESAAFGDTVLKRKDCPTCQGTADREKLAEILYGISRDWSQELKHNRWADVPDMGRRYWYKQADQILRGGKDGKD